MRLAALLLACLGCAQTLSSVKQAGFDHSCPTDNVRVIRWGPQNNSVLLDVCGTERNYHRVATPDGIGSNWLETQVK